MAKPKAPKPNTASKPIRGKSYSVDYESLDNPPPGAMNPLSRHPIEAETIRGRQVAKLKDALKKGGAPLQSIADHLAFVAAQADPSKPGTDYVNLAPYMEALEQLPVHQRKIILDAAGNPAVFAPVLDKGMPDSPPAGGDTSWADDLMDDGDDDWATALAPSPAPVEAQPAPTLGDVQAPPDPSAAIDGQYSSANDMPMALRYSTWAGSDTRRAMRMEKRAEADRVSNLNTSPLVYDQMAEYNAAVKAGKVPVLPPVRNPVSRNMLSGANLQSFRAMLDEIERVQGMPVDPQRFDAENDFVPPPSQPLNFIDVLPDNVSGRMTGRRHQLRLTGPDELAGTAAPSEPVDRMAGVDSRTPFEERFPAVFRTQQEKDGALALLQGRLAEIERRIEAIPDDLAARRAALPPIETQVLKVGTGAVGDKMPVWSERKGWDIDKEVDRRMRAASGKTLLTLDEAAQAFESDPSVTWDLDTYYPRWRARLSEVDANRNVTPASRPPSGMLLAGLIADAAGITDPDWPASVAPVLETSIKAQASLPPSTDDARKYADMVLSPAAGGPGIEYLAEVARTGNQPFPFFTDLNVPMWTPSGSAADDLSWADDLSDSAPATAAVAPDTGGDSWADDLFDAPAGDALEVAADAQFASQIAAPAKTPSPMAGYPPAPVGLPSGDARSGTVMDPQSVPQQMGQWPSGLMSQLAEIGPGGERVNRVGRPHRPMTAKQFAEAQARFLRAVSRRNYMDPDVPVAVPPSRPPLRRDFSVPPEQPALGPLNDLLTPAAESEANWAAQLDATAEGAAPPADAGLGWADESLGTDFVAPEPPSSDTNWADDFSMYGDPAIQGFAALDTMNRRRAQNPLAALLA